jgi:cellulose synthase/poly-beta-1,6-N-acetylglucosamine synthase-like glycosyltransferase
MFNALDVVLAVLAVPVLTAAGYLGLMAVFSWPVKPPAKANADPKFDVIIPAHNESAGIAQTIKSVSAVDYPAVLRRVIVVADNCTDDTATQARDAGATVLERTDAERRGKGYALAHAFEKSLRDSFAADAVVVVDADTVVSANLLKAFAARLGAGEVAAQAHYGVRNPTASWRTRLMRIALAMFHQVRSSARERWHVSCGLRGNGMCFRTSLLRDVPHEAFSLVEDLEYGIRLGRAGHRVAYAGEAHVLGEMVSGEKASRSQRSRWEHGRAQMAKALGWPLIREGLQKRSGLLLDLAMDVLVPPLSRLAMAAMAGLVASGLLLGLTGSGALALSLFSASVMALGAYGFAGWLHSGTGLRGLLDLALAPGYVAWKAVLVFQRPQTKKPDEWVRTTREGEPKP